MTRRHIAPDASPPWRIRTAARSNRRALMALGHAPDVVRSLAPSSVTRLAWALTGVKVRTFVAAQGTADLQGSVQFVEARRDSGTWMFGHWRVAAGWRRRGLGRQLLDEGAARVPGLRNLYSYVEWGNGASIAAHLHLGFEMGEELQGSASLATLSTLGPAAPPARLTPVSASGQPELADLYRRSVGSLWMRLFPGGAGRFWSEAGLGAEAPTLALLRALREGPARLFTVRVDPSGAGEGFVVHVPRSGRVFLYADPARCDAGLLAKVAGRLLALGLRRECEVALRGLPRALVAMAGAIRARAVMGKPQTGS